jgi:hypothetical protein
MRESGQNKQWTSQMSKCKKNKTLKYVVGCSVGEPREEDTRDLNILDSYSLQFHAFVPLDRCHEHCYSQTNHGNFCPNSFSRNSRSRGFNTHQLARKREITMNFKDQFCVYAS